MAGGMKVTLTLTVPEARALEIVLAAWVERAEDEGESAIDRIATVNEILHGKPIDLRRRR